MNVFVLCAGRTASTTFAKASSYIEGFTAGHETRANRFFADRVAYPANHIEVDNRLAFFLGQLDAKFGDSAYYVHLMRDEDKVAASYRERWYRKHSIVRAFYHNVMMVDDFSSRRHMDACRFYVETNRANIESFLKDKSHVFLFDVDNAKEEFERFANWLNRKCAPEGLSIWQELHNLNRPNRKGGILRFLQKLRRTALVIPTIFHDV